MRLHHVAQQQLRRLTHRYALSRRLSITTTLLILLWLYTLYWGERSVFKSHIQACDWSSWEQWPQEAAPHHLVFIADPQLVDPHTYPGRPWPLSTLTEQYTDQYMSRNFRLINEHLDPDSIVFLGDLFDGGRDWGPDKAKRLKTSQRRHLENIGVLAPQDEKRIMETYRAALSRPHANSITKADHNIARNGEDLKAFKPGENGRWEKWGGKQWYKDLDRFAKIFYDPAQLYPNSERTLFAAYDVPADATSIENGGSDVASQEYATQGGKARQVISSLPGNHDLGFGAGVQLVVRDRFESHFGPGNRIDVLGNHTFVSVDGPSLSARSQYMSNGWENEADHSAGTTHLWEPSMDFLEDLGTSVPRVTSDALKKYYPEQHGSKGWLHEVTDPRDPNQQARERELDEVPQKRKPQLPLILLSHVPLFRNPDTECGPLRESGHAIRVNMGYQYQNVLTHSLSRELVTKVSAAGEVAMIFSGDDHDYCDITHRYNIAIPGTRSYFPNDDSLKAKFQHIREISVKSFSWAMGVRKPGFMLVSLWNPVDTQGNTIGTPLPTIQTHLCLLPDQLSTFIDYALLFLLTLPVLLIYALVQTFRPTSTTSPDSTPLTPLTPIKMSLPRFQIEEDGMANGFSPSGATKPIRHQRGASTSTSTHSRNHSDGSHLGVQRSYNARTRSVSPPHNSGPLIDKAGFYPQVKWIDPADEDDSDEESNVGTDAGWAADDSQAKWKWRRRTPGRARKVLEEFAFSLFVVAVPGGLWYFYLVSYG